MVSASSLHFYFLAICVARLAGITVADTAAAMGRKTGERVRRLSILMPAPVRRTSGVWPHIRSVLAGIAADVHASTAMRLPG